MRQLHFVNEFYTNDFLQNVTTKIQLYTVEKKDQQARVCTFHGTTRTPSSSPLSAPIFAYPALLQILFYTMRIKETFFLPFAFFIGEKNSNQKEKKDDDTAETASNDRSGVRRRRRSGCRRHRRIARQTIRSQI